MSTTGNPFDTPEFLETYWQQSPLLKRKAFPDLDLMDADELAGLAMEHEVESRLITHDPATDKWQLRHGPLSGADLSDLPPSHWTLLVQAVDHWVPEVRTLLKAFQFLPQWRIDDIMISFATDQGGVGPHFDQYDVFLIQLSGERRWKIGQMCDDSSDLVNQVPVKLLSNFEEQDAWVLGPGDVLYVPPGVAHWGESIGDSMTISVGFRAPSESDVVSEVGHYMSTVVSDFQRYQDLRISRRSDCPHAILDEDIDRVQAIIERLATDRDLLEDWFGRYMTEPKYDDLNVDTGDWPRSEFANHWRRFPLYRNPSSRLAYSARQLFVDGEAIDVNLPKERLHEICDSDALEWREDPAMQELMYLLLNNGAFIFED